MANNDKKPTLVKTNIPQADITLGRTTPSPSNSLKPQPPKTKK